MAHKADASGNDCGCLRCVMSTVLALRQAETGRKSDAEYVRNINSVVCDWGALYQRLCASCRASTTTGGMAGFHGVGEFQEFAPDFGLWNGEFWGESTTDSESGPLHFGAWYCTGEQAFQGGTTKWGGGFCTVTDVDGDTVNLRWQATEPYGPGANIGTRGDYYSGTGKYAGITGWYTFHCENVAISHFFCTITGGEYNIP